MDRMLRVKEVGEILGYRTPDVIRKTMRQMVHMEQPLRVSESALQAWINQRTFRPAEQAAEQPTRIPRRRGGRAAG